MRVLFANKPAITIYTVQTLSWLLLMGLSCIFDVALHIPNVIIIHKLLSYVLTAVLMRA